MSHRCPEPLLAAILELFHHGDELPWAAVLGHDPPQAFTTDSVEGLDGAHVSILSLTFMLKLPCSMSMVSRSFRNPHWLSGRSPWSRCSVRRLSRILASILLAMERSEMPWLCSQD